MKIIHYNILDGCMGAPARLESLLRWLKAQEADLVTLNELNGWGTAMERYASRAGFHYATLFAMEGSGYHIGVMTRQPHEVVLREEEAFAHGVLGIACGGITILITHLTPCSARDRREEVKVLATAIESFSGPVLLAGDLNTLSPFDRESVEYPQALQRLRETPSLARKFLDADGNPDYVPMETLLAAGLTDLGTCQEQRHTVPTRVNQDPAHALPLRLDYLLANDAFVDTWGSSASVVSETATEQLSDHYPLCCEAILRTES